MYFMCQQHGTLGENRKNPQETQYEESESNRLLHILCPERGVFFFQLFYFKIGFYGNV